MSALDKCNASLVMDLGKIDMDDLKSLSRLGAGQAAGTLVRQCMGGRSWFGWESGLMTHPDEDLRPTNANRFVTGCTTSKPGKEISSCFPL